MEAGNLGRTTYRTPHFFIGRLQSRGRAKHTSATGATSDFDLKEHLKQTLHLTVTEAKFFIAKHHGCLNVRAELNAGGAGRIRRLQFVPPLNRCSASIAGSRVNGGIDGE